MKIVCENFSTIGSLICCPPGSPSHASSIPMKSAQRIPGYSDIHAQSGSVVRGLVSRRYLHACQVAYRRTLSGDQQSLPDGQAPAAAIYYDSAPILFPSRTLPAGPRDGADLPICLKFRMLCLERQTSRTVSSTQRINDFGLLTHV